MNKKNSNDQALCRQRWLICCDVCLRHINTSEEIETLLKGIKMYHSENKINHETNKNWQVARWLLCDFVLFLFMAYQTFFAIRMCCYGVVIAIGFYFHDFNSSFWVSFSRRDSISFFCLFVTAYFEWCWRVSNCLSATPAVMVSNNFFFTNFQENSSQFFFCVHTSKSITQSILF